MLTLFLQVPACIINVEMLPLFPSGEADRFGTHFRTPEIRRAAARHTSIAHSVENTQERVVQSDLLPTFFSPIESAGKIIPRNNF